MVAATLQSSAFARRFRLFLRWLKENGIEYTDGIVFELGGSKSVADVGIRAAHDLQTNDLLANIPKQACLTVRTTAAAQLIEEENLGGVLGLAVALMHERSLKERSRWYGYLQLIPEEQNLPFLWSLDKIDSLFQGTELHQAVKDDKNLMKDIWEESISPLPSHHATEFPAEWFTLENYLAAKTIVDSRAFEVDEYHGYGLVPLADLFNHKTAAEDVHFSTTPGNIEIDEDYAALQHESNGKCVEEEDNGYCRPDESSTSVTASEDDDNILQMILVKDVREGAEIFNTYGTLSNGALLHRYGFTEKDNPFDIVNIDWELINATMRSIFSTRHVRRRLAFWRKVGSDSHKELYFEISADGEPEEDLLTLLYILYLPDKSFERLSADWDLQPDKDEGALSVVSALGLCGSKKKRKITQDNRGKIVLREKTLQIDSVRRLLLTRPVRKTMQQLIAERDNQYPTASLDEDLVQLAKTSRLDRPELFHVLTLRCSERAILKKCLEKMSQ